MAVPPRSRRGNKNQEEIDLLQALIETPPAPRANRPVPVALRSIERQRDHTLSGFLRRTWVDHVLTHTERVLIFAALMVFGIWVADGPLRDWLHTQQQHQALASPAQATPAPSATPDPLAGRVAALLPYSSPSARDGDIFLSAPGAVAAKPAEQPRTPTRLVVPKIALDTPVKEVFVIDGVWEVADYAAGFMHGTALPGDQGNTVLAGHAGIRGAVFRDLPQLAAGDDIYIDAGGWRFHYRVRESTSVWPTQVEVLASRQKPELTLITCTNWDTQRLVVVADLLDSTPSPGE
ncbi:sortase [Chloroflexia bacterium SDU3-3]|nr:sortase [Chloroflexia bacterium SDU3-3]